MTPTRMVAMMMLLFIFIPDVSSDIADGCQRQNDDSELISWKCHDKMIEVTLMTEELLKINCASEESSIGEEGTFLIFNRSQVDQISFVKIQNCQFKSEDSIVKLMTFLNVNESSISKLELLSSDLRNISENFLSGFSNLTSLILEDSDLEKLDPSLFKDTKLLSTLSITNSSLKIIHETTFHELENLNEFTFNFNKIANFPSNLFLKNSNLRSFEVLQNNANITELPDFMFQSSSLEVIDIQHSPVTRIASSWLSGCNNLKRLILRASMVRELPEEIFSDTKHLGLIDVSENLIQNLPEKIFSGMENLQFLFMNNNLIKQLDESLFVETISLRKLQLQHNLLGSLNQYLLRTTNYLEEINLSNNNLLSKDTECFKNQNLQHVRMIDLSFNKFFMINFNFFLMSKLQYLNLSHNAIGPVLSSQDIDFKLTFGLTVDLSFNSIEVVDLREKIGPEISKGEFNLT